MTNEAEELAEIIYRFKYPYVNNFKSVSVQDIDSLAQHLVASGYINKKNIKLTVVPPPKCNDCDLVSDCTGCEVLSCSAFTALNNRRFQLAHNLKEIGD
jgi:hypothetical protein